jgi:Bacterial Ig-like domain
MKRMSVKVFVLAVGVTMLAACGGGGSDAPTAPANYFPLDSGNRWVLQESGKAQTNILRTTGPDSTRGVNGIGVHGYDANDGTSDDTVLVSSASGVRAYFKPPPTNAFEALTDGTELFRLPARAGDSFVQTDQSVNTGADYDRDAVNDQVSFRSVLTVVGTETLTTPAGTFADCLHVRVVSHTAYTYSTGAPAPVFDTTTDYWYAPNIGPVSLRSTATGTTLSTPTTYTENLVGYRVGTRSTDTVAPTVTTIAPAAGSTVGAGAQVQITFNEALYGESINPALLRVLDSNGQAVAGTAVVEGAVLRFVNTQLWAAGAYTIELAAGVPDLLGNTSTQTRSIAFTVN